MGNAKLKPKQVEEIEKETGFTEQQIKEWFKDFRQESGSDAKLNFSEFKHLYNKIYPHSDGNEMATRVFKKFDLNGSGKINFEEFICALGVTTNGSTEKRMSWVFSMYDLDDNGTLDRNEVLKIMMAVNKMAGTVTDDEEVNRRVHNLFKNYDKNNDDTLSITEFMRAFKTEPSIRDLFADQQVFTENAVHTDNTV